MKRVASLLALAAVWGTILVPGANAKLRPAHRAHGNLPALRIELLRHQP